MAAVGEPVGPVVGGGVVEVVVTDAGYGAGWPGPVRGRERLDLRGGAAVITGAAAGMGALHAARALAEGAGPRGAGRVSTHVLDVADRAALEAVAEKVLADDGGRRLAPARRAGRLLRLGHGAGAGVGVTTSCPGHGPGHVSTGMFAGARGPLTTPVMTPRRAVAAAWRGLLAGTPVVLAPASVALGPLLRGVLPTRAFDVVVRRLGVHSSTAAFTGRPRTAPEPSARSARG